MRAAVLCTYSSIFAKEAELFSAFVAASLWGVSRPSYIVVLWIAADEELAKNNLSTEPDMGITGRGEMIQASLFQ